MRTLKIHFYFLFPWQCYISEFSKLQQDLDAKLNAELQKIGDEFYERDYYLKKWNVVLDETKNCINYWNFAKGVGIVQSPILNK